MTEIKFGTDGWRAIIAQEYTVDNVKRVAEATAKWLNQKNFNKVVIGYDCRFGGPLFSMTTARILASQNIEVLIAENFVSTPMVSLGVVKNNADLGIVITASHNPPSYNGYKLKSNLGGPSIPKEIAEVEALIPHQCSIEAKSYDEYKKEGLIKVIDLEEQYFQHVQSNFDFDAIRAANLRVVYDAMYGAGQNIFQRLLPDSLRLHCEYNPSFHGQAPEPINKNLELMSQLVASTPYTCGGIANDGDADRIGMCDENGEFVDSHRILLLLLYYMAKYKDQKGKVVISFSVTNKVKKLAEHFGLEYQVTKIGFKYIAEIMINEDVIVGGEESGGIAIKGHIPERDGIWIGLTILEFMAKTGKKISELLNEIYEIVGAFEYDRDDLHISESLKQSIIEKCKNNEFTHIGNRPIESTETIDGFKYYLPDDEWVMVRPSGTEPVLRVYAQGNTKESVREILDDTHATLKG